VQEIKRFSKLKEGERVARRKVGCDNYGEKVNRRSNR
jgi:hypothetical protein